MVSLTPIRSPADPLRRRRFGNFPEKLAAIYVLQMCRALEHVHRSKIVHRDVKGSGSSRDEAREAGQIEVSERDERDVGETRARSRDR